MKTKELRDVLERGLQYVKERDGVRIPDILSACAEASGEAIQAMAISLANRTGRSWASYFEAGLSALETLDDDADALAACLGFFSFFGFSLGMDIEAAEWKEKSVKLAAQMAESALTKVLRNMPGCEGTQVQIVSADPADSVVAFDKNGNEIPVPRSMLKPLKGGE